jgi:ribosomal protein S12 methylthiotransferase
LEGRHEGLAPEIDGVVYIDGNGMDSGRSGRQGNGPNAGEFVTVTITGATTYDVVGHLAGESSPALERASEPRQPRGDYR